MFLTQSNQVLEENEADKLVAEWNGKQYMELSKELDNMASTVKSLTKKRKKRLFKISKRLGKIFFAIASSEKYCVKTSSAPKKEVSTFMFHNSSEEWAAKIKSILEGPSP
jgi:hypothetical protein